MLHSETPKIKLSNEYIRGLVEGEGCFTFTRNGIKKIPAFCIQMHQRDFYLLTAVKDCLGLKNKIYRYRPWRLDGIKRGPSARLIVREIGNLKNIIIPFFYKRLMGHKGKQFEEWLNNIGTDPLVPESFKILCRLHKSGYWDKNIFFSA